MACSDVRSQNRKRSRTIGSAKLRPNRENQEKPTILSLRDAIARRARKTGQGTTIAPRPGVGHQPNIIDVAKVRKAERIRDGRQKQMAAEALAEPRCPICGCPMRPVMDRLGVRSICGCSNHQPRRRAA